jgi:hypothetical protein
MEQSTRSVLESASAPPCQSAEFPEKVQPVRTIRLDPPKPRIAPPLAWNPWAELPVKVHAERTGAAL